MNWILFVRRLSCKHEYRLDYSLSNNEKSIWKCRKCHKKIVQEFYVLNKKERD